MAIIIKLVDGLNPFDKRGACICAGMCVSAESDFWLPWNAAEPTSKNYEFDSESDDGRSVGYCQQQTGPDGELWWGPVSQEMSPEGSIGEFLKRLIKSGYNASSAQTANDSVQAVQRSGVPQGYRGHWDRINQLYDSVISGAQPAKPGAAVTDPNRPDFNEYPLFLSGNSNDRNTADIDLWLMHTQEPPEGSDNRNNAALELRNFLESTKGGGNPVSYHYSGSQAGDGGTTVIDCVDTDEACWAVGNSNGRSINFCFAGSRSDWTREEWLANERGTIAAAAYLFVQDCAKYPKLKARVIAPNYSAPPGAADHNYCTKFLKDGNNHTDVGPNFPWDVFTADVQKYATGTVTPPVVVPPTQPVRTDRQLLEEVWDQLRGPGGKGWPQLGGKSLVDGLAELLKGKQ